MFYSETLLSKTGPLARVWLSANLERKLRKPDILQTNIETSVNAILDQGQAPLALRLSGQLLLGVVRIYSRKANFLFDDCNEAILKIRMAFRPGNVDLPQQAHTANAANLILPDVITELDLLAPLPDASLIFGDDDMEETRTGPDPTRLGFGSSQQLLSTYDRMRRASTEPLALDDLDLDLNLDTGDGGHDYMSPEVEVGRRAPAPRRLSEEMDPSTLLDNGPELDLDFGDSELDQTRLQPSTTLPHVSEGIDIPMGGMDDDFEMGMGLGGGRDRQTLSPLTSIRSSAERDSERTFQQQRDATIYEPEDEETIHLAQRAKRRKVQPTDVETEMHSSEIRALQNDRSKILKPAIFLPKDPILLALMEMQRNGNFVSSILGDGRQRGLAPELRGILSLEVVRKSAELKRKRDAGTLPTPSPELELQIPPTEEDQLVFDDPDATITRDEDTQVPALANEEAPMPIMDDEEDYQGHQLLDNFDETVAPILHPADSGPISLGTKHAVHLLRERFGPDAASTSTPSKRTKASVLFHDMLPERTTTRADATKMFFEVLVLATKDAIKVEQEEGVLGGPLRLRGKRGLWGSWAEERTDDTQDDAATGAQESVTAAVG